MFCLVSFPVLKCEYCQSLAPASQFRGSKRFCSKTCAKRYALSQSYASISIFMFTFLIYICRYMYTHTHMHTKIKLVSRSYVAQSS